jgi:hypothetical protein
VKFLLAVALDSWARPAIHGFVYSLPSHFHKDVLTENSKNSALDRRWNRNVGKAGNRVAICHREGLRHTMMTFSF